MSKIGFKYGSEWHLMHYLGRHRNALDRQVLKETKGGGIEWLDFCPKGPDSIHDAEWKGIDFLFGQDSTGVLDYSYLRNEWATFWPQTGSAQCWDAIGILRTGSNSEWLLVEAKAHLSELSTSKGCMAGAKSLPQIQSALAATGSALGVMNTSSWTGPYYQYANRLAALWFLLTHGVPARLLYVYFTGDPGFADSPDDEAGWKTALDKQDRALGLEAATNRNVIDQRVHKIFLPVRGK
jgi:hypothetical protein